MQLDDYIDRAIERNGLKSDRGLARHLGLSSAAVPNWRTHRTWPNDDTMRRLADLAGVSVERALCDLNTWRATTPEVRKAYQRIAEALPAVLVAAFILAILPPDAYAGTGEEQAAVVGSGIIYYATRAALARLANWLAQQRLAAPRQPFLT
jgi:hypothetical protein